jgi:hypothetical protein
MLISKSNFQNLLLFVVIWVSAVGILSGCASMKEKTKGFLGVSTKVLEEGRSQAAVVECNLEYNACYAKVKEILKKEESYIYADDSKKRMIAFYVSKDDTTPVGIFLTAVDASHTRLEVSSASTYTKQIFAEKLSVALNPVEKKG